MRRLTGESVRYGHLMLITIVVTVGAAAAVIGGVIAAQREPDPALIPIPVKRPRRQRPD